MLTLLFFKLGGSSTASAATNAPILVRAYFEPQVPASYFEPSAGEGYVEPHAGTAEVV